MKRFIKYASIILTLVLFVSFASSCGLFRIGEIVNGFLNPETPIEELPLDERANKVMEKMSAESKENESMDVNLKMVFEGMALNGTEFTIDISGVSNYRYLENGEYQYLQTQTISTILPGTDSDVSTHTLGFIDGKMFQASIDGSLITRVYSELTSDEFKEHMDITYGTEELDISEDDYVALSCEKINNKWVTEFSIFTEHGVDVIQREILSDVESLVAQTHTISEIVFTVVADADFNMTGYEISAEFEVVDEKYNDRPVPTLEYSVKAEDVFSPKPLENIDFSKYTKVDDLRAFDTVNKLLNDKINDEYCELVSEIKTEIIFKNGYNSQRQENEQKYSGYYKNTENGFEYSLIHSQLDSTNDYRDVTMEYKDLTQVSSNGSYSQTESYKTDHEARLFIEELIDPVGISIDGLKSSSFYNGRTDLYKFEFENAGAALGYTSETFGASLKTNEAVLTITLEQGEIVSYSYALTMVANNGISVNITINCTYSK